MTSSREDYLKAIAELQRSRERVGNRHIADYLGVSAASVSEIIRKMEKEGLVESMERRSIRLTRKGEEAAMQLVRNPRQFDVLVTENLFGDILSDEMAMICGSLGMLPSASLCQGAQDNGLFFGLYEPSGGSAPDIAGKGIANPIAQILSLSMLLRYSLGEKAAADAIDAAVRRVIDQGCRTGDLATGAPGEIRVNTAEMGDAIIAAL